MSDHPMKIYPTDADVEAPPPPPLPTVPLIPPDTTKSDNTDAAPLPPSNVAYPPPPARTIPLAYSDPPNRRLRRKRPSSCLCRCFCFILSLVILIAIIIGVLVAVFFLVFHPKLPHYSINTLKITSFNLATSNGSLSATFDVNVTAINPNKHIGIYYEGGSSAGVWYQGAELAQGELPVLYQGHRNTTVLDVTLEGQTSNGTALVAAVQEQLQQSGGVPLTMRARVRVKAKVGKLKLMTMKFKVDCDAVVDSLSIGSDIGISSSSCDIKLRF